jgi:hypothetical protein
MPLSDIPLELLRKLVEQAVLARDLRRRLRLRLVNSRFIVMVPLRIATEIGL